MKHFTVAAFAALLALPAFSHDIEWAKNFEDAQMEARKTDKLIMIDFYTDWCTWCKELDKQTFKDPVVSERAHKLVSVKVNAEKEGVELAKKYHVNGFPTVLFIDAAGDVYTRVLGFMPPDRFLMEIEKAEQKRTDSKKWQATLSKNPKDLEAIVGMLGLEAMRGQFDKAELRLKALMDADPKNAKGHFAKAYNTIGDAYQEQDEFKKAIGWFEKGLKAGKSTEDIAYSRLSIATCAWYMEDMKTVIRECEAVLKLKDLSDSDKQIAEDLLKMAKGGGSFSFHLNQKL
jgi:thioredoxin-related protein